MHSLVALFHLHSFDHLFDETSNLSFLNPGTSRPVFVDDNRNKKVVGSVFQPFLRNTFPDGKFVVWIEADGQTQQAAEWKGVSVVPLDQNSDSIRRRKTVKYFWSNLKKKVFKNWNGGDVSEFKSRVIDSLLSMPESEFEAMFAKMKEKMRRDAEKRRHQVR